MFAGATAFGISSLGVAFSFKDELKLLKNKEASFGHAAFIFALVVPSSYFGYKASNLLKLECSSQKLYDYLTDRPNWQPHQMADAKALFLAFQHCIPRKVTFGGLSDNPAVKKWLSRIESPNRTEGVYGPSECDKMAVLSKLKHQTRNGKTAYFIGKIYEASEVEWGDSVYERLFGVFGLMNPLIFKRT